MPAAVLDIEIIRGDNDPATIWQLVDDNGQPFTEPSSSFVLVVVWQGGQIVRQTGVDPSLVYDPAQAMVTWTPSTAETASLPLGRLASYSLQRRTADQHRMFVTGMITGTGRPIL